MKKGLLLLFLLFTIIKSLAQRPLTDSRQSGFYTYLYSLTDEQVRLFYAGKQKLIKDEALNKPVAVYLTDHPANLQLPPGNYLKVVAVQNKLQYTLLQKRSANFKLLENSRDIRFILLDSNSRDIVDAQVFGRNGTISFDAATQTYHTGRSKKDTLLRVVYQGISNFYNLNAQRLPVYHNYDQRNDKAGWLTHLWNKWMHPGREEINRYSPPNTYPGFMVMNKPKYRLGDTVKVKAFILKKRSKRPIADKKLIVRLKESSWDNGKIIGYAQSYRKGGFEYSFVLNDSLKLQLDQEYFIGLESLSSKKYNLDDYHGDLEEEQYLAKRTLYQQASFRYEEYELKANKFEFRTDKTEHSPGLPASFYFKATDDNGLNVPDGRVELTLTTDGASDYADKQTFVPDTLWRHQITLDQLGETKLIVPDSIFPKAKINYKADAVFLNSNNERREEYKWLTYDYHNKTISTKIDADTLKINYLVSGKDKPAKATLMVLNADRDTIKTDLITLPSVLRLNTEAAQYVVKIDSLTQTINVSRFQANINVSGYRAHDSLFVSVDNPRHLKFWYTIFVGNRVFEEGTATSMNYRKPFKQVESVSVLVNYIWAGKPMYQEQRVPYQNRYLNIAVKQPVSVYPGQQANIEVNVTDDAGKAVAGADITAYAFTRKFENYASPNIPYLGKIYRDRKFKSHLQLKPLTGTSQLKLNWAYQSKNMGLDSIEYYRFTHPDSVYRMVEPAPEKLTQIAPFIVKGGDVIPVHILYIDEVPVYFSQSNDLQRYSFTVDSGRHSLRVRTASQIIRLDHVLVPKGKKLILSINADTLKNKTAHFVAMPDTLTEYEASLINKYMVSIVSNYGSHMATIAQKNRLFLLNYQGDGYYYRNNGQSANLLAGPLADNDAEFAVKDGLTRSFLAEPGYSYEFQPDLLKQKSLAVKYPFGKALWASPGITDYRQYALTNKEADTLWQNYLDMRSHNNMFYYDSGGYISGDGRLSVKVDSLNSGRAPFVKSIIVYKNDDPDYMQVFAGNRTDLGTFRTGKYRIFYLFKGNSYYLQENISIKPGGINYYSTGIINPHQPDSISLKLARIINAENLDYHYDRTNAVQAMKEVFNEKYLDSAAFNSEITGHVYQVNEKGAIAGANIRVKGTNIHTVSDASGFFRLKVPKTGKLVIGQVGFITEEVNIDARRYLQVYLKEQVSYLKEVVVIGYGSVMRRDLTGSISTVMASGLYGRVGAGVSIQIRGVSSINTNTKPLYVVDSVIYDDINSIPPDMIGSIDVLKDASATAIYGSRAANGVVIISTKKGKSSNTDNGQPQSLQNIRHNFSDYAYWQPRLITNEEGKASFKVTYPDDITSWRTFVVGMTDKQQSGMAQGEVKAFKPLSANFTAPLFAIRGDTFRPLGKVLKYTADTVGLNRTFRYNGKVIADDKLLVKNSRIDTFKLTAGGADSLHFEYTIKRSSGYFDGEKRDIPVFEQGTLETRGTFNTLERDTSINLQFVPNLKEVTLRAEASVLPVLLDETEHLRNYEYLCNEQLASKLKALLAEKQIRSYLAEPFKWDSNIKDIIKKLQDSRRREGTWGWWKDSEEEMWISLHVTQALLAAEKQGFKVLMDKQKLIDYLVYQVTAYHGEDKLSAVMLLKSLNSKADLPVFVRDYEKQLSPKIKQSGYDKLRLMLAKQAAGMPIEMDSLMKYRRYTMFGNVYWGEKSYQFFNNAIQMSLLAYQILKHDGQHPELLSKIRNYFLEQRQGGYWRNTYESAQILETILPDLLIGGQKPQPASIVLSGDKTETITKFPYTTTLTAAAHITVKKSGQFPVYVTAYQKFWNPTPEKVSKDFVVDSWFEKDGKHLTAIKGGQTMQLQVKVTAKAEADYTLIEIPIPAGCSYDNKEQGYTNNEVHREYFKNKVSIFCRRLSEGPHYFTVKLVPRYGGVYHVNPAKAEMMYFPVFYGREGMKMFSIE